MNPRCFLTSNIPNILPSTIRQDMFKLLQDADQFDEIHDVIFKVDDKVFPAHRFVFSACDMELLNNKIHSSGKMVIELPDIHPDIFYQFLLYVYTGSCDLIVSQKCPARLEEICKKPKNKNNTSCEKVKDPVRLLQECAKKMGFRTLQKLLEDYCYQNGYIKCRTDKYHLPIIIKFNRCSEQSDVLVKTKNGKELAAHKCVLVARMEYFNNLFSLRWSEVGIKVVL